MSELFWLTDAQTARLQPYFPRGVAESASTKLCRKRGHALHPGWENTQQDYQIRQAPLPHLIMFGRLKDGRRVATRYDRCSKAFFSAVALAATVIFWL